MILESKKVLAAQTGGAKPKWQTPTYKVLPVAETANGNNVNADQGASLS